MPLVSWEEKYNLLNATGLLLSNHVGYFIDRAVDLVVDDIMVKGTAALGHVNFTLGEAESFFDILPAVAATLSQSMEERFFIRGMMKISSASGYWKRICRAPWTSISSKTSWPLAKYDRAGSLGVP